MNSIEGKIRELEEARGKALVAGDYDALAALNADDLVHIHATGQIESKHEYLRNIRENLEFLAVSRPQFFVRAYGGIAVSTGRLKQSIRIKASGAVVDMEAAVMQVWRDDGDCWRCCNFQATRTS